MKVVETCDILIVGGGVGGCAAALAATSLGKRVVLTEETDWIGGQFTSQAVPPDEHPWIETFGCTRRYRAFRNAVRQYYRDHLPLRAEAANDPALNPGRGGVSRLCHEPRIALAVLEHMLAPAVASGHLTILLEHVPVGAEVDGDRITAVHLLDKRAGDQRTISAPYVLDATELGDLLALAGVEHATGTESRSETGEPHAPDGAARPDNVQAFTWCMALGHAPGHDRTIERPAQYDRWRAYIPPLRPAWPGPLLSWTYTQPITLEPISKPVFGATPKESGFWTYRRITCRDTFLPEAQVPEATIVNWPQNDYLEGNLIGASEPDARRYREEARQLSLSLFYWMQTEAPRPEGGEGYPGLYLRPDITGTPDGLAKAPYIREARRLRARFTVTERHIGAQARGLPTAERFPDSVGIGYYRIDLHPSTGGDNYIDIASLPFQIPLGALIPVRLRNLLPAAKNLGVTHISNGCYRLHPVEWNVGEAAGLLAAYAMDRRIEPAGVYEMNAIRDDFQALLRAQGVELEWPENITPPR
jgi:hypothetical protein